MILRYALVLGLAVPALADSTLELSVPGASDSPREKLNLSITIPTRLAPRPQQPARERIKSSAMASVDWSPFKVVPQKSFIFETLRIFKKKGVVQLTFDQDIIDNEVDLLSTMVPTVARIYNKLADIHRKDALRKFGLVTSDIERFQRMVDILAPHFATHSESVVEMNKRLDQMIEELKKSGGRGQIRITSVKEQKDGSTLLEMEVLRGPTYTR